MADKVKQELLLTGEGIGDNLDLEVEGTYPCSDGSMTMTISVDKLLEAQVAFAEPLIRKDERERIFSKFENEYEVIQTFGKPSPYITFKVRREEWQDLKGGESNA